MPKTLVRLLVFVLLLATAAEGEETPISRAYEKAQEQLGRIDRQLAELRQRNAGNLSGKERYQWPYEPTYVRIETADVDRWTAAALTAERQRRIELNRRRAAWMSGTISLDTFYHETYADIAKVIGDMWSAHLTSVTDGYVPSWHAEIYRLREEQEEARRKARAAAEKRYGYGTAGFNRVLASLERRQSEERRRLFENIAARYRKICDDLAAVRAEWAREEWKWADFARRRSHDRGDEHDRAAAAMRGAINRTFGDGPSSTLDFFYGVPGSRDRLITTFSDAWILKRPYPDVQIYPDAPAILKMNRVGQPPVERFRAEDEPFEPLRPTAVRVTWLDGERPLEKAMPLQFVRLVAEADGLPSTDSSNILHARVRNRVAGKEIDVPLKPWSNDPQPLYVSEPLLIARPGAERNEGVLEVSACTGETVDVRVEDLAAQIAVGEASDLIDPLPCGPPKPPPRFRLRSVSKTALTFDPENRRDYDDNIVTGQGILARDARGLIMHRPPLVEFSDESGAPLEQEAIVWYLPERDQSFLTYTDARGLTRLEFRVAARGTFVGLVDGLPTGEPFGDGVQKLIAFPSDPAMAALLDGPPPAFTIDFVRPTTIDFVSKTGLRLDSLVSGEDFRLQIWLGKRDAERVGAARSIKVRIDPPIPLRQPFEVEADRMTGRVFQSQKRAGVHMTPSVIARLQGNSLLIDPNDAVTASFGQASVGVIGYLNGVHRSEARVRAALNFWRDSFRTALNGGPDPAERFRLLRNIGFMERGLLWLDDAALPLHHRVPVAAVYLDLVEKPANELGFYPSPVGLSPGNGRHKVVCDAENLAVGKALDAARAADIVTVGDRLSSVGGRFVDFVVGMPDMLFVTPFLGAYTAATGWTADGEVATTFEQLMGGFDAVAGVFTLQQLATGVAARITSAGKAAFAVTERAAVAEGLSSARLTFAKAFAADIGEAVAREAAEQVIQGGIEAIGDEFFAGAPDAESSALDFAAPAALLLPGGSGRPRVSATVKLARTIERRERYIIGRVSDLGDAKLKLAERRSELASVDRRLQVAGSVDQAELRATRSKLAAQIENLSNERIPALKRRIERHYDIAERARIALNRLEGISWSVDRLQSMGPDFRPHARDLFNGTPAYTQYERQIAKVLPEGFEPGRGVVVKTAYPSPLAEGYLKGNAFQGKPRGATKAPIPDYVNKTTFDAVDAKYYDFSQLKNDRDFALCAAEIAETIDKARMVQEQLIFRSLTERTRLANPDLLRRKAILDARQRTVTIFTPTDIPDRVKEYVQQLATTPEKLIFKTAKAEPLEWLKQ